MKVNRTALLALAVVVPLLIGVLFLFQPVWLFHWQDFRTGNEIISRVEAFRKSNGRLPDTLKEVGRDDPNRRVYYIKLSKDEYCVFFGISVGESETYSSRSKQWGEGWVIASAWRNEAPARGRSLTTFGMTNPN